MDCKVGDVVHIRGQITAILANGSVNVHIYSCHANSWTRVKGSAIVYVEPRPIAVGDTVRNVEVDISHYARMEVIAIARGRAWCSSGSNGYDYIIEVEKLERVP